MKASAEFLNRKTIVSGRDAFVKSGFSIEIREAGLGCPENCQLIIFDQFKQYLVLGEPQSSNLVSDAERLCFTHGVTFDSAIRFLGAQMLREHLQHSLDFNPIKMRNSK